MSRRSPGRARCADALAMQKRWSRRMRRVKAALSMDPPRIRVDTSAKCAIRWPIEMSVSYLRCWIFHHDEKCGNQSPSLPSADLQRCVLLGGLQRCHLHWPGHTPVVCGPQWVVGSHDEVWCFECCPSISWSCRGHSRSEAVQAVSEPLKTDLTTSATSPAISSGLPSPHASLHRARID
jgi:hypothetical protein